MKKINILFVATTILLAFSFKNFKPVTWKVKNDYTLKFENGAFSGLTATITFDEENPGKSFIWATVDATTIKMGSTEGTVHAKEALETAKFPLITFVSTAITKNGDGKYEAKGNLKLKGVTKEIKFPFTFDSQKDHTEKFPFLFKETFQGKITINPKDFGITRSGTPNPVILEFTIPVTK